MSELLIGPVRTETFSLEASSSGDRLEIRFAGNADMDTAPVLKDYLKRLHTVATQRSIRHISFDFRELYFMNSSCFKCFVVWINAVAKGPRTYAIRFSTNSNLRWQSRSLEALRNFAPSLVTVDEVA